jgi:hypothetical protein
MSEKSRGRGARSDPEHRGRGLEETEGQYTFTFSTELVDFATVGEPSYPTVIL